MRKKLTIITIVLLAIVFCSSQSFSQTGKWTQMFPANSPPVRSGNGIAYLSDDKVIIFGGQSKKDSKIIELGDTWIYDLSENNWIEIMNDTCPLPREALTFTHIADGKALLFGGEKESEDGYGKDTWLFDIQTMKWKELFPKRSPAYRTGAVAAYYSENKILLYGGHGNCYNGFCDDTWLFDLEKCQWDSITAKYPRGRELSQMSEINDDEFVLYSGNTGNYKTMNSDVFVFSKKSNSWKLLNLKNQNVYRCSTTLAKLADNIVMVFGGDTDETWWDDNTWLLNLNDSIWIQLNLEVKPPGRRFNSFTNLGEGKVLLFGGAANGYGLNDTWLFEYDPTGVKDSNNFQISQIKVYNIGNGNCRVNCSNLAEGQLVIELYDLNGNLVKNLYSNYNIQKEFEFEFSTAELQTNAYFLIIKTKEANYYKQIYVVH